MEKFEDEGPECDIPAETLRQLWLESQEDQYPRHSVAEVFDEIERDFFSPASIAQTKRAG